MSVLPGQLSLTMITTPAWVECFKTCRHFDSHAAYPPDRFPGNRRMRRCTYSMHEHGTSGEEFWQEVQSGVVEMYCKYYETEEEQNQ